MSQAIDFFDIESKNGIRFTWNNFPSTLITATKLSIPLSSIYTPLKEIDSMPVVEYSPLQCSRCNSTLNPYVIVDFKSKTWICNFCNNRNTFPPNYAEVITENNLPAELMQDYSTIEYKLNEISSTPVFLFAIDLNFKAEELKEIKDSIQQVLYLLPDDSLVGLITYGKVINLYDLSINEVIQCFSFDGSKDLQINDIINQLGLSSTFIHTSSNSQQSSKLRIKKFLVPINECEFTINSIIDDLSPDVWPILEGNRPKKSHHAAIQIGLSILKSIYIHGGRLLLFASGPSTMGPGQVVSENLSEFMRCHNDITQGLSNSKYMEKAKKAYGAQAVYAASNHLIIDLFFLSLDQSGLAEMKCLSEKTGGNIIMTDSPKNAVFKKSFSKFYTKDENGFLRNHSNAVLTVTPSKQLKICGIIGFCESAIKKNMYVSDTVIGIGNTNSWNLHGITSNSTYTIFYEVVDAAGTSPFKIHIQFATWYYHSEGRLRLRITTVERNMYPKEDYRIFSKGFDQEAAAVVIAKYATFKCYTEDSIDIIRWLDKLLIRFVAKFAEHTRAGSSSFRLPKEVNMYPQFMYNLRRGPLIQIFNETPDETEYFRFYLLKEGTNNCLLMIQPSLLQYTATKAEAVPVNLFMSSLKPNIVLLLDTFFNVIIWHGETVVKWRQNELQNKEEYQNIKLMLETPFTDAESIIESRIPVPKFIICDQGDSYGQERLLKNKVVPDYSGNDNNALDFRSDDVPLSQFTQQLIKLSLAYNEN